MCVMYTVNVLNSILILKKIFMVCSYACVLIICKCLAIHPTFCFFNWKKKCFVAAFCRPVSCIFWCYLNMFKHIHPHFGFSIPWNLVVLWTYSTDMNYWVVLCAHGCALLESYCSTYVQQLSCLLGFSVRCQDLFFFLHSSWFHLKNPRNLPLVLFIFNYVVHLFFVRCACKVKDATKV